MDLLSSESGGVPVHTALDPSLVTDTERSFQGGEVEDACNADDRLMLKTVVPASSSNMTAFLWSHKIQTPKNKKDSQTFSGRW
jgi:hypothetical protein